MKVVAVVILAAYCSLALGKEEPAEKGKRGLAATYTTPRSYSTAASASAEVAYATAKVSPQTFDQTAKDYTQPQYQVKYVQQQQQQQAAPVQYQYDYEQQYAAPAASAAVHHQQPQQQVTKLAPAKAYAPASPVHFSLASDVSSFSYSSPLVSYSNLGLLKQTIGKTVEQPAAEQSYAQPQIQQYTTAPQYYKQVPKPATQKLAFAPVHAQAQKVYQPAQRIVYAPAPQPTHAAPVAPPAAQPQAYKAGSTIVYANSAEEAYEKIYGKPYVAPQPTYVDAHNQPQQSHQTQQAQAQAQHQAQVQQPQNYQGQQVQYVKLTPQQYAAYTQQLQQQQQQQQQQQVQYVDAHNQQYSGSHSEQQPIYVAHNQPQYYQTKYTTPGVTYASQQ